MLTRPEVRVRVDGPCALFSSVEFHMDLRHWQEEEDCLVLEQDQKPG